jgi:hypothetical protein
MDSDAQQVEQGWVILDDKGRIWARNFFATKVEAEATAEAAVIGPYSMVPAERITSVTPTVPITIGRILSQTVPDQP